ncbi:MAG: cupin domain-containing protein [Hyphomicrobium sp.]|nr:cupin domain-containing protein [Hyphomicrobium sp.]
MPGKSFLRNAFPRVGAVVSVAIGWLVVGASGFALGSFATLSWLGHAAADQQEPGLLPVVAPLLSSGATVAGETIVYPAGTPNVTAAVVTLAPGAETGWHRHGVPVFGYMLEGELTVTYDAQTSVGRSDSGSAGSNVRVLRGGDALLEAMAVLHNGRNTGSGPARILAVFMGAEGVPGTLPR